MLSSLIPSIVLGLLLVFRTNTAYERFWKGRQWGSIVNNFRSLTRLMWTAIDENDQEDRQGKAELEPLLRPHQYKELQTVQNVPLCIPLWIEDYLHQQHRRGHLSLYQPHLHRRTVGATSGCETSTTTLLPRPFASRTMNGGRERCSFAV